MSKKHEKLVQQQFGQTAGAYVTSLVHAQGADLKRLSELTASLMPTHALDLGCGGGHVSYAIAPYSKTVTACDLSIDMLEAVAVEAAKRELVNVRTVEAVAEQLPFSDGEFDFLACRYSAHHWRDASAGLIEARRVLKSGSTAVFIDVIAPCLASADTHLQAVELLRDASHARDYNEVEWSHMLKAAGFKELRFTKSRLRLQFSSWTERMRTPSNMIATIRQLQTNASKDVSDHFQIEADGTFTVDTAYIEAR